VADRLAALLPDARLVTIGGAGHMGPITHRNEVNTLILAHSIRLQPELGSSIPPR
jgi:pimeloyl-ACP methyl ester carboxylesterase